MKKSFIFISIFIFLLAQPVDAKTNKDKILQSFDILNKAKTLEVKRMVEVKEIIKPNSKKDAEKLDLKAISVQQNMSNTKISQKYTIDRSDSENLSLFATNNIEGGILSGFNNKIVLINGFVYRTSENGGVVNNIWKKKNIQNFSPEQLNTEKPNDKYDNEIDYIKYLINNDKTYHISRLNGEKTNSQTLDHYSVDFNKNILEKNIKNFALSKDSKGVDVEALKRSFKNVTSLKFDIWLNNVSYEPVKCVWTIKNDTKNKIYHTLGEDKTTIIYTSLNKNVLIYAPENIVEETTSTAGIL